MGPVTSELSGRARLRPELRRAQLIECALAAAAEHGLARLTHSHVATRAGVSIPAVHSYFRGREDLVEGVLAEVEAFMLRIAGDALRGAGTPFERLQLLATRFAQDALDNPDRMVVWLDWSTGVRSSHWARYLEVLDQVIGWSAEVIRETLPRGATPDEVSLLAAARDYIGGGHTVALLQFAGATSEELSSLVLQLARSALRARG